MSSVAGRYRLCGISFPWLWLISENLVLDEDPSMTDRDTFLTTWGIFNLISSGDGYVIRHCQFYKLHLNYDTSSSIHSFTIDPSTIHPFVPAWVKSGFCRRCYSGSHVLMSRLIFLTPFPKTWRIAYLRCPLWRISIRLGIGILSSSLLIVGISSTIHPLSKVPATDFVTLARTSSENLVQDDNSSTFWTNKREFSNKLEGLLCGNWYVLIDRANCSELHLNCDISFAIHPSAIHSTAIHRFVPCNLPACNLTFFISVTWISASRRVFKDHCARSQFCV